MPYRTAVLFVTAALASASVAHASAPPVLQVVELFQSQGCSSCPPANANVLTLADRPEVLTLSWQVTYWDHLGWRDSFGRDEFTRRQYAYAGALGHRGVWTPQVVINGGYDIVGADRNELGAALRGHARSGNAVAVALGGGGVTVNGAAAAHASVWLVRYDPRTIAVPIRAGENAGRTLPHRNVVRAVSLLGRFDGGTHHWAVPAAGDAAWRTAVLVQQGEVGPVLGAAHD